MDTLREMYRLLEQGAIVERVVSPADRLFVMVVKHKNAYRVLREPFHISQFSTFDELCAALEPGVKPWRWRIAAEHSHVALQNYSELIAFAEFDRRVFAEQR